MSIDTPTSVTPLRGRTEVTWQGLDPATHVYDRLRGEKATTSVTIAVWAPGSGRNGVSVRVTARKILKDGALGSRESTEKVTFADTLPHWIGPYIDEAQRLVAAGLE